jgi:antitoxin VapB
MEQVAKLFANGRSQAVRLPAQFRFDGNEVFIRQDPHTSDLGRFFDGAQRRTRTE